MNFPLFPRRLKNKVSTGPSYDPDAIIYFTALGNDLATLLYTDLEAKTAVNNFIVEIKDYNIWPKGYAFYAYIGGTAAKHAVNLRNPGTYNLTFYGGWTHSDTGSKGNGITGYADTGLNSQSVLNINNVSLSLYSRTQVAATLDQPFRCNDGSNDLQISPNVNGFGFGTLATGGGDFGTGAINVANSDARGMYRMSRNALASLKAYKNSVAVGTNTNVNAWTLPNRNLYIGAANANGIAANFSILEMAWNDVMTGLNDTESAQMYNAVQTLQTALYRNV